MNLKLCLFLLLLFNYSVCIDNPHFYRASYFFGEPRIKKNNLFSVDTWFRGGSTNKSFNNCGDETALLNLCGPENIKFLGKNVSLDILQKMPNDVLIDLWQQPTLENFGKLKFFGDFKIREVAFDFFQNFGLGFFAQLFIPISKLEYNNIDFNDLSMQAGAMSDAEFIKYRHFVLKLKQNLSAVGLNFNNSFSSTAISDIDFFIGWTFNYEDFECIDFIDNTFKVGLLFPTGRTANINTVFDLPQGYDGFFAIPIQYQGALGIFEWLSIGGYAGAFFFLDKTKKVRMKTAFEQNGYIKLTTGEARISQGTLWNLGLYLKADHVCDGFSFTLAYRFDKKEKTRLNPCDFKKFNYNVINSDCLLQGWQMHTLNFIFEYDFATLECPNRPRASFFFDVPVSGRRIYDTTMSGVSLGLDYVF